MPSKSALARRIGLFAVSAVAAGSVFALIQMLRAPDLSDAVFWLGIGVLGLASTMWLFLGIYLLDGRRDSRRLKSAAHNARLTAERTRRLVERTSTISEASERQTRAMSDLLRRPYPPTSEYLDRRFDGLHAGIAQGFDLIQTDANAASGLIINRLEEFAGVLTGMRAQLSRTSSMDLKGELENAVDHIYALIEGLLATYSTINRESPLPPLRGWAVSPDLAALLATVIADEKPSTILETGSGISTLIMGLALRRNGHGRIVALEHDAAYAAKTESLIEGYGLGDIAQVAFAPLTAYELGGTEFVWYDLANIDLPEGADLLFIDGPPRTVGPLARYPALPLLRTLIHPGTLIVVDDTNRSEEVEMLSRWNQEFGPLDIEFLPHEKGTAFFAIPDK
jgi:predicted O-methyltransferase YrrM